MTGGLTRQRRSVKVAAPMRKKEQVAAEPGFEKALAELESIVARMEDGGLTLEQSLAAHKRGLELARQCRERLAAAEQQVRVLEGEVLKPLGGEVLKPLGGEVLTPLGGLSPGLTPAASDGGERD